MSYIYNIFKRYKCSLLMIYLFVFIAQIEYLIEPYVLGKMIDGLLIGEYYWLVVFFITSMVANVFMYKRMVLDTKIYTTIYNDIVFEYLKNDKTSEPSAKIARTEMANNIINFLENDLQYYIMAIMSLIGTLFFVFLQDYITGFVVALCLIPVLYIIKKLYKKIAQVTKVAFNQYEKKIGTMNEGNDKNINSFFERRRKIIIHLSTLQGKNWFSLNSVKTLFLVIALVVFTSRHTNISQGQAVTIYTYINQFLISLMSIPIGVETFTRIKDVIHRIKTT